MIDDATNPASGQTLLQLLQRGTDRLMLGACALLLVICAGMGAVWGDLAVALLVGVPALAVPLGLYLVAPGSLAVRLAIAASMMIYQLCAVNSASDACTSTTDTAADCDSAAASHGGLNRSRPVLLGGP